MPLGPDPAHVATVAARLDALRSLVADGEDDLLASLVVTGEPRAQRVLDDWVDQVADSLRALGEVSDELAAGLAQRRARGEGAATAPAPDRSPAREVDR